MSDQLQLLIDILQWLAILLLLGMYLYQEDKYTTWHKRCLSLHRHTTQHLVDLWKIQR